MFNTKKNFRRSSKNKQQKSTKKIPQYEEDYNEVILNDLLDSNKNEAQVQEEPTRKTKKNKAFKFNLGPKKKSTYNKDSKKNTKSLNKNHKKNKEEPKEIIDNISKNESSEIDVQVNDKNYHPKKEKKSQPISGKGKKTSNKKSKKNNTEESSKKTTKKSSKKQTEPTKEDKSKKQFKKSKRENIKIQSVNEESQEIQEEIEIENINENENEDKNINEDEIVEPGIFRNMSDKDEQKSVSEEGEKEIEQKMKDIIWSDDKFPKN